MMIGEFTIHHCWNIQAKKMESDVMTKFCDTSKQQLMTMITCEEINMPIIQKGSWSMMDIVYDNKNWNENKIT